MIQRAEQLRGLSATRPLAVSTLGAKALRRVVVREIAHEREPRSDAAWDDALHLLGVLHAGQSLAAVQRQALSGQVAGLYVPRSRRLYVLGAGGAAPRSVIAHEVVHALQDEHFNLTSRAFGPRPRDHDGELAAQALVEGDATEVQSRYVATLSAGDLVSELARTLKSASTSGSEAAPPYLQRQLLYPYTAGQAFVRALRARGGQRLLDRAFRNPPRTTRRGARPGPLPGRRSAGAAGRAARRDVPLHDHVRRRGSVGADGPGEPGARMARRALRGRAARARSAPRDPPRAARSPPRCGASCRGRRRSPSADSSCACESCAKALQQRAFPADRDGVEPSPGRVEAESAAERRLHAVVDTLGLHVYSGETHPDDRFVTKVALTPAMLAARPRVGRLRHATISGSPRSTPMTARATRSSSATTTSASCTRSSSSTACAATTASSAGSGSGSSRTACARTASSTSTAWSRT